MVGQTRFDNGNRKFSRARFLRVRPRVPDEPSGFCPTKARKFRISAFRNTRRRAEASEIAVTKNMRSWRLPRHFLIKIARIRRFSQKSGPPPHWEMNPRSARSPIPRQPRCRLTCGFFWRFGTYCGRAYIKTVRCGSRSRSRQSRASGTRFLAVSAFRPPWLAPANSLPMELEWRFMRSPFVRPSIILR